MGRIWAAKHSLKHNSNKRLPAKQPFHMYRNLLKTLNCQRPVFSLVVSHHMHKRTHLWRFELNWSSRLRDNKERKKHHCHTKLCAFDQMLDFETSKSNSKVLKSNSWKSTSFSKTALLQKELFLTMFYTINLFLLLVTK